MAMKIAYAMPPNRHSGLDPESSDPGPSPGQALRPSEKPWTPAFAGVTSFCRRDEIRQAGGGHESCTGRRPVGPAGFTLIELLLALSLFVMIAGVVFAAFSGVMKGVEQGRRNLDVHRLGRTALLRMAQEVRAAMPDDAYAGFSRGENDREGDHARDRLTFVTVPYRPASAPGSDVCEIAYYIGANAQGAAALYREQDCTPDGEPLNGDTMELTDAAVGLDVTYYDAEDSHDEWPDDAGNRLPCLVRLALTLRDEPQAGASGPYETRQRERQRAVAERAFIITVSLPMSKGCRDVPRNG